LIPYEILSVAVIVRGENRKRKELRRLHVRQKPPHFALQPLAASIASASASALASGGG